MKEKHDKMCIDCGDKIDPRSVRCKSCAASAWQVNKTLTIEHRKKISKALTGRVRSAEECKSISLGHMGHPVSKETRRKLSNANTGYKFTESQRNNHTKAVRKRYKQYGHYWGDEISEALKGRKLSPEHIENMSKSRKGRKLSLMTRIQLSISRGGDGNLRRLDSKRDNPKEVSWRKKIFERDDYTCQLCGVRGRILNAHHIYLWSKYSTLRYKLNNGITLCKECHYKIFGEEDSWVLIFKGILRYKRSNGREKKIKM